ncbi:MAG: pyruvate dehydrogenase complex E1 component subunit beta, partial [Acidobacteriota bacterium]|nr:pyruvate dehydrogenase complex E1 component subunit beta [Acidobacteriota bacterium]
MAVITYLEAISQALRDEMRRDENVILLGEDIAVFGGAFKVTVGFLDEFGEDRVIDTPISESGFTGAACGAAVEGLRPVVEFQFADFIACAFDQIVNYAAKNYYRWGIPMPVVFRGPAGGGFRGGPYHSQNPEAWFTHVPGLKVVQPSTPYDAKGLLIAAIRDNNPVIYFEHKHLYRRIKEDVPDEDYVVPIGVADVKREGTDLTVVTYGAMVHKSLAVAERLSREGAECEVVDLRSLSPLDRDTFLASVRKTSRALVVHEAQLTGGFGGEVAAIIGRPMKNVAPEDTWNYIAGFAPANDVGAQDFRETDG